MSDYGSLDDALARWNSGEFVWSVEMGGLGPGYEQAIQVLAFTLIPEIREGFDWTAEEWDATEIARFSAVRDAVVHRLNPTCGFSGAQVGAATNIASVFCKRGYSEGLNMVEADRRIQVSQHWPRVPQATKEEHV